MMNTMSLRALGLALPLVMIWSSAVSMSVDISEYGSTHDGKVVHQYTLINDNRMSVKLLDFGGTITQINLPDKHGEITNVLLELPNVAAYEERPNFSTLVGRFANRIGGGFELNGVHYELQGNPETGITLHGGPNGFFSKMWSATTFKRRASCGVILKYFSPDGEGGFPGALDSTITFELNNKNELSIEYRATTTKPTIVNMTHHMFINMNGWGSIEDNVIRINASHYLPMTEKKLVTGDIASVSDSPFDFREEKRISQQIDRDDPQLELGSGFDHNFVLDKKKPGSLSEAANLYSEKTGISLTILTTEPGIQFYSGNLFNGKLPDVNGRAIEKRFALALEPQHFPDSPHHDNFPSTVLMPGGHFESKSIYRFSSPFRQHR